MNRTTSLTPWTIGEGVVGPVLSVGAIITLVINRRYVGVALKQIASSLFSQIDFFSIVIIVFMVISVLESGAFFDANITHHAIFGLLGLLDFFLRVDPARILRDGFGHGRFQGLLAPYLAGAQHIQADACHRPRQPCTRILERASVCSDEVKPGLLDGVSASAREPSSI